jgi:signal recognition particle subunit SRP54
MGPIAGILGMLPGAGQMKEQLANIDDRDMDRAAAIIQSMTPQERADPKIINASRRARISKGSGVTPSQVNQLVERFFEARKMMTAMAGRFGLPGAKQRNVKGRKGKKSTGRGPTPPKVRGGIPGGLAGMLPPGPGGMPGMPSGMPQLPPGFDFDPTKIKLPKS